MPWTKYIHAYDDVLYEYTVFTEYSYLVRMDRMACYVLV